MCCHRDFEHEAEHDERDEQNVDHAHLRRSREKSSRRANALAARRFDVSLSTFRRGYASRHELARVRSFSALKNRVYSLKRHISCPQPRAHLRLWSIRLDSLCLIYGPFWRDDPIVTKQALGDESTFQ
jgi:hypothetical protein